MSDPLRDHMDNCHDPSCQVCHIVEMTATTDIVGFIEIAERLGVGAQTVRTWAQRPYLDFPEPDYRVSGVPAWEWTTIDTWAKAHNRGIK